MGSHSFAAFDTATTTWCGADLASWVRAGTELDGGPVRCPVATVAAAGDDLRRLDLALRQLHAQPESHWCRDADDQQAAVVLSWPLPARAVALFVDGTPATMVLAVGRQVGAADLWRFHLDAPDAADALTTRAAELLALV